MKVKNIMFSGFAAAILMGTASASAVTFNVASKDYVDNLVGANGSITQAVSGLNEQINGNGTTTDGLAGDVSDLNEQINGNGTTTDGLAGDVSDLQDALGDGFSSANTVADAIDTKQDKLGGASDAGKVVTATANAGTVTYTTVDSTVGNNSNLVTGAAVQTYVANEISGVTGGASIGTLPTDPDTNQPYTTVGDALSDMNSDISALESKVGNGTLANGFSSGVDDLTEAVNDLQSTKANAADVYTKNEVNTLMSGKLNVPEDTCSSTIAAGESAWCALVSDGAGNLKWAKITAPFAITEQEEQQTTP